MAGKMRPSLRAKTLTNVQNSNLSITDKKCIAEVFSYFDKGIRAEARSLYNEAKRDENGNIVISPILWERITEILEILLAGEIQDV